MFYHHAKLQLAWFPILVVFFKALFVKKLLKRPLKALFCSMKRELLSLAFMLLSLSIKCVLRRYWSVHLVLKGYYCHSFASSEGIHGNSVWQQILQFQLGGLNLDFKCRISLCQLWYMKCRKPCECYWTLFLVIFRIPLKSELHIRKKAFSNNLTSGKSFQLHIVFFLS